MPSDENTGRLIREVSDLRVSQDHAEQRLEAIETSVERVGSFIGEWVTIKKMIAGVAALVIALGAWSVLTTIQNDAGIEQSRVDMKRIERDVDGNQRDIRKTERQVDRITVKIDSFLKAQEDRDNTTAAAIEEIRKDVRGSRRRR